VRDRRKSLAIQAAGWYYYIDGCCLVSATGIYLRSAPATI
jgi:hypothetical protein